MRAEAHEMNVRRRERDANLPNAAGVAARVSQHRRKRLKGVIFD